MGPTFEVKCRVLFIFFSYHINFAQYSSINSILLFLNSSHCFAERILPKILFSLKKKGRPSTIIRFCLQPNSYFLVINSGEENSRSCNNYFGYVLLIIFLFCVFLFLFSYYLFKVRSFPLFVDENLAGFVFLQLHIRYVLVSVHA